MPGCPSPVARRVAELERRTIVQAALEDAIDLVWTTELDVRLSLPRGAPQLDLGTAGLTLAISSVGGYPTSSCNAGIFGERKHHEDFPLVAFFCTRHLFDLIKPIAHRHSLGLYNAEEDGQVVIFANDIGNFPSAALDLLEHSMRTVRGHTPRTPSR